MVRLTLYARAYCHLCEDMVRELGALGLRDAFELDVVDVDRDPALEQRYGERVPVLTHGEHEICHYHLDRQVLAAYLVAQR